MLLNAPEQGSENIYQIRSQEVDANQYLKMSSLLMLMQETSMENALKLHISIWDEQMGNSSWVLLRKEVSLIGRVKLGEKIRVVTYPAGFDRVLAYRDFIVYNDKNELVATASSTWTLMNLSTRRLERIPTEIYNVAFDGETLPRPQSKLRLSKELGLSYEYVIRYGDLDWNGHVNNIVLTKLMVQATKTETLQEKRLEQYTIHIKSECLLEETVQIMSDTPTDSEVHYQLIGASDGRVIASAQATWR